MNGKKVYDKSGIYKMQYIVVNCLKKSNQKRLLLKNDNNVSDKMIFTYR